MTEALNRLDDHSLARIGVSRHLIAKHAQAVAERAVPVPPKPKVHRAGVMARLRARRDRQKMIRELSALDDRLLRDIGIESDQIFDVADEMMKQRLNLRAAHPKRQNSASTQETSAPHRHRPAVPAAPALRSRKPVLDGTRPIINAERKFEDRTLNLRPANQSQSHDRRQRVSAG